MTEAEIKREICEYLDRFPQRILFTVSPPKRTKYSSKFMRAGWPDIYGIFLSQREDCIPFFIEVKKPGGMIGLHQHQVLERVRAMGAIACLATCVEDVKKELGI